jgi:tRNA A37 threonylcarbamoyladenosine dehydratase
MTKNPIFERLSLLTGKEGLEKLSASKVLVFGAGGVGSWAAEALVRSGIGKIGIIDNDIICASNINRQIEATTNTIGQPKATAIKKRLLEINPECEITAYDELFCLENAEKFDIKSANYVIDAIDTLNHKLDLIEAVNKKGITLFSSMGMALKIDPSRIKTASIWKTDICPLARLVRQGLRKRGFTGDFTVVYSEEPSAKNKEQLTIIKEQRAESSQTYGLKQKTENREKREDNKEQSNLWFETENREHSINYENFRRINGSMVTVTATAGFLLASLVINDVIAQ